MPNPPDPKKHEDADVECNDTGIYSVTLKFPKEIIADIKKYIDLADEWAKAAPVLNQLLSGKFDKAAKDVVDKALTGVESTEVLFLAVTGDCDDFDSIEIECTKSEQTGFTKNPFAQVEGSVDPGPISTKVCKTDKEKRCKTRIFTIIWTVKISFYGFEYSYMPQIDKVYVSSCCCSKTDAPPAKAPAKDTPPPKKGSK